MKPEQKQNIIKGWPVYLAFVVLALIIIWAIKAQPNKPRNEHLGDSIARRFTPTDKEDEAAGQTHTKSFDQAGKNQPLPTLLDIARKRKTWDPIWISWYTQRAPNFRFYQISDNAIRSLSDYAGRNVLLVFWATWCPPCVAEIPHLIELRKTIPENRLAILALSDENIDLIKKFAAAKKINYTLVSGRRSLPKPFSHVTSIPSTCFIDELGRIKFATTGMISLPEIKAIIKAVR